MKPYYDRDGQTIYHGDCREILPTLDKVDLVLTDPPYGINSHVRLQPGSRQYAPMTGDQDDELAAWLLSWITEMPAVVWGANKWPHLLPHKGRWICWDKRCDERADKMLGSAFELAWENVTSGFDSMIRCQHGGVVNADRGSFGRSHPTQKPMKLSTVILNRYPDADITLDPFMGSGTTLRAAKDLGRKAIGIEIEEKYCEIAANRLAQGVLNFA